MKIVVWSDPGCPWSLLAIYRLRKARAALGYEGRILLEHHAFPLELYNDRPTPRHHYDPEISAAASLEPEAGWKPWSTWDSQYPVTMLPALEAVQAAREQSVAAAEELDFALRTAFYAESQCISMRHVILSVATSLEVVDVDALASALDSGSARSKVVEDWHAGVAKASPHFFLPDGSEYVNPGVKMHFQTEPRPPRCIIDENTPEVFDEIVRRSAAG